MRRVQLLRSEDDVIQCLLVNAHDRHHGMLLYNTLITDRIPLFSDTDTVMPSLNTHHRRRPTPPTLKTLHTPRTAPSPQRTHTRAFVRTRSHTRTEAQSPCRRRSTCACPARMVRPKRCACCSAKEGRRAIMRIPARVMLIRLGRVERVSGRCDGGGSVYRCRTRVACRMRRVRGMERWKRSSKNRCSDVRRRSR